MVRRANRSGTLYKRGAVWYVKIPIGGKWLRQSTGTGDKAKARTILDSMTRGSNLTDAERLAVIETRLRPSVCNPELLEAWDNYTTHPENVAQSEIMRAQDGGKWNGFLRWIKTTHPMVRTMSDVTAAIAVEYVMDQKRNTAPKTINDNVRVYRRVWRLNGCAENPWLQIHRLTNVPHLRRALTNDEVAKLIREADGELKLLFAVGAFTGLRMSDCSRIRWEDFDRGIETITVTPSKTRHSSGRSVAIPVHPALRTLLCEMKKRTGFVMPGLAKMDVHFLSYEVMNHFKKCGFEEPKEVDGFRRRVSVVGFHSLRSTFITNMANIGAPMAMVQAIVGHMTAEMSMHYYRSNAETARSMIDALPGYGIE